MPRAKRRKVSKRSRFQKRRKYRARRYKKGSGILTLYPGRSLLPKIVRAKLRYCSGAFILNPGTGTIAIHQFACNSLHDPDVTGTGHQPRGYDQLMDIYRHYAVTGAKITCSFDSRSANANNTQVVGIALSEVNTVPTDVNDLLEDRLTRRSTLCPSDSGRPTTVVKNFFSTRKWFGASGRMLMQNSDLRGTIGVNVTHRVYFNIFSQAFDDSSNPDPIYCRVTLEYTALFYEPKSITGS